MANWLDNLRRLSPGYRLAIAFLTTCLAAVVLVPLWVWNSNRIGVQPKIAPDSSVVAGQETTANATLPNPLEEIDKRLQEQITQPVKVKSVKTVDDQLVILFDATNTTFANLALPSTGAFLQEANGEQRYPLLRATTADGRQLVPVVTPGQDYEGALYFAKVFNGQYYLHLPRLKYDDQGQDEFEQIISVEVADAYLPRT